MKLVEKLARQEIAKLGDFSIKAHDPSEQPLAEPHGIYQDQLMGLYKAGFRKALELVDGYLANSGPQDFYYREFADQEVPDERA